MAYGPDSETGRRLGQLNRSDHVRVAVSPASRGLGRRALCVPVRLARAPALGLRLASARPGPAPGCCLILRRRGPGSAQPPTSEWSRILRCLYTPTGRPGRQRLLRPRLPATASPAVASAAAAAGGGGRIQCRRGGSGAGLRRRPRSTAAFTAAARPRPSPSDPDSVTKPRSERHDRARGAEIAPPRVCQGIATRQRG